MNATATTYARYFTSNADCIGFDWRRFPTEVQETLTDDFERYHEDREVVFLYYEKLWR